MVFTFECKIDEGQSGVGLASTLRHVADMFEDRDPVSACVGKVDGANFRVGPQSPRQALKELAECVSKGDPRVSDLVEKALKISRFE